MEKLKLSVVPGRLSICQQAPSDPLPAWALEGAFSAVTRTPDELSIVCASDLVPDHVHRSAGWKALKVEGPLDFALTGILAGIAGALAEARISIFAISTFDTDYILVREGDLEPTVQALRVRGYTVI